MLELNELTFEVNTKEGKTLVMFYKEKGCRFCEVMKPIFKTLDEDAAKPFLCAKYEVTDTLEMMPDKVMQGLGVKSWPTFVAIEDGVIVGAHEGFLRPEQLPLVFTPQLLPQKKKNPRSLRMGDLKALELSLVDQLAEIKEYFGMVKAEIERREKLANGPVKACCGSCAEGGACEGGSCGGH